MAGLRISGLLIVLASVLARCGGEPLPPVHNLVLICLDTVRFDAFLMPERAGFQDPLSQELKQAVVFTKAQSAAPWTLASVASVLTGLYPAQHGAGRFARAVANLDEDVPTPLAAEVTTLTERLQMEDFTTVLINANPWLKAPHGLARGFDITHARKGDGKLTRLAQTWLQEDSSQPFFLYVHMMGAHGRHVHGGNGRYLDEMPRQWRRAATQFAPADICLHQGDDICRRWQLYVSAIADQRKLVAELMDTLKAQGLLDSTLVILYADHGEEFQEHLRAEKHWGTDPRQIFGVGHGQSLFQELLHVPLVVWHPALPGQRTNQVVSLVDVTPTILNWLGFDVREGEFAGRIIKGLHGGTAEPFQWLDYDPAYWPEMDRNLFASGIAYGPEQIAVITDGWKYIWHEKTGESYLFNLRTDPGERDPLVNPEVATRLEPALDKYFRWLSERPTETAALSDQQIRELKGVGYLQGVDDEDPCRSSRAKRGCDQPVDQDQ